VHARERLRAHGFARVSLWVLKDNVRAIRFYTMAGFKEDAGSTREIVVGGKALQEVRHSAALT
jgi:ribosomal protein S18 acetylase RimI-like enzyme